MGILQQSNISYLSLICSRKFTILAANSKFAAALHTSSFSDTKWAKVGQRYKQAATAAKYVSTKYCLRGAE